MPDRRELVNLLKSNDSFIAATDSWELALAQGQAVRELRAERDRLADVIRHAAAHTSTLPQAIKHVEAMGEQFPSLLAERVRLREALVEIANRPTVERNPDGEDQAAHTMQWIAREALGRQEEQPE